MSKKILFHLLLFIIIGVIEYLLFLFLVRQDNYGMYFFIISALLPYSIYIIICLLVDRRNLINHEQIKEKKLEKLKEKMQKIEKQ